MPQQCSVNPGRSEVGVFAASSWCMGFHIEKGYRSSKTKIISLTTSISITIGPSSMCSISVFLLLLLIIRSDILWNLFLFCPFICGGRMVSWWGTLWCTFCMYLLLDCFGLGSSTWVSHFWIYWCLHASILWKTFVWMIFAFQFQATFLQAGNSTWRTLLGTSSMSPGSSYD